MPKFAAIICLLIIIATASDSRADADAMRGLLEGHGISGEQLAEIENAQTLRQCFSGAEYVTCICKDKLPKAEKGAEVALARNSALLAKKRLFLDLLENYPLPRLAPGLTSQNLKRNLDAGLTVIPTKYVEFSSFRKNGWLASVASIQKKNIPTLLAEYFSGPDFLKSYGKGLLARAEDLARGGKYAEALALLRELHELNYANVNVYLAAADSFLNMGQMNDARKLAANILEKCRQSLDAGTAARLGELFISMGDPERAEQAFLLAEEKGAGNGVAKNPATQ